MAGAEKNLEYALAATGDELAALLHHPSTDVLLALLDNPALDESQLCILLEQKTCQRRFWRKWRGESRC